MKLYLLWKGKESLVQLMDLQERKINQLKIRQKNLPKVDSDKVVSMLNQLVRIRQGKIVRLADSSKLTADLGSKLTVEEEVFYNQINNASNEFKKQIIGNKK